MSEPEPSRAPAARPRGGVVLLSLVGALMVCVAVAAVTLAVRWDAEAAEFDRESARAFTRTALEHAGLEEVEVRARVAPTRYRPRTFGPDDPPLSVFRTSATAAGGTVELLVHPRSGRAVFLRDIADDGGPLLDDEQYRRLRDFSWTAEADHAADRRTWGTVGVVVLAVAAGGTAYTARREKIRP